MYSALFYMFFSTWTLSETFDIASSSCFLKQRNIGVVGVIPFRTEVGARDFHMCLERCRQDNLDGLKCLALTWQSFGLFPCYYYGEQGGPLMETFGVDYYLLRPECYPATTTETVPSTLIPPAAEETSNLQSHQCAANEKQIIVASSNQRSSLPLSTTLNVQSDFECVKKCIDNEVPCVAVDVTSANQCRVYTERVDAAGLIADPSADYYEKTCFPRSLEAVCPEPVGVFYREANSFLAGVVNRILFAYSARDCLIKCIELGLECASANFYPQTGNCLIKKMRRTDRPDLYGSESNFGTVYLENGCYVSLKARGGVSTNSERGDKFGMPGPLGGGNFLMGISDAPGSLSR